MSISRFLLNYWPAIVWGMVILVFTGVPGNMIPRVPRFMDLFAPDKIVHLILFLVFAVTVFYGIHKDKGSLERTGLLAGLFLAIGYSALSEFLQWSIFINRQASIWDFIADVTGAFLGIPVFRLRKGFFQWKNFK